MSGQRKIQHPRTYRGRKMPEKLNINAIFLRQWRESRLGRFYSVYRDVIVSEIREKEDSGEWSFANGKKDLEKEQPDCDPQTTRDLALLQDTFDFDSKISEHLPEVHVRKDHMDMLQESLSTVCFLSKSIVEKGLVCFSCKHVSTNRMKMFWVRCIECDTHWCHQCYVKMEKEEDNHKALVNKTRCETTFYRKTDNLLLTCNAMYGHASKKWDNRWEKCPRCSKWRCAMCIYHRKLGSCKCVGELAVVKKFYAHPCPSGKRIFFVSFFRFF